MRALVHTISTPQPTAQPWPDCLPGSGLQRVLAPKTRLCLSLLVLLSVSQSKACSALGLHAPVTIGGSIVPVVKASSDRGVQPPRLVSLTRAVDAGDGDGGGGGAAIGGGYAGVVGARDGAELPSPGRSPQAFVSTYDAAPSAFSGGWTGASSAGVPAPDEPKLWPPSVFQGMGVTGSYLPSRVPLSKLDAVLARSRSLGPAGGASASSTPGLRGAGRQSPRSPSALQGPSAGDALELFGAGWGKEDVVVGAGVGVGVGASAGAGAMKAGQAGGASCGPMAGGVPTPPMPPVPRRTPVTVPALHGFPAASRG
jgi:hypothetical protein